MARSRFEYDPDLDADDYGFDTVSHEKLQKPTRKKNHAPAPRYTRLPKLPKIQTLSRPVSEEDSARISGIINPILADMNPATRFKLDFNHRMRLSIMSAMRQRFLVRRLYGNNPDASTLNRFNNSLLSYTKSKNSKVKEMPVQFGKLDTFGKDETEQGFRYVSARIIGTTTLEALENEYIEMLEEVVPANKKYIIGEEMEGVVPHVSLIRARDEASVQDALTLFQGVGLENSWVNLGELIPELVPLKRPPSRQ